MKSHKLLLAIFAVCFIFENVLHAGEPCTAKRSYSWFGRYKGCKVAVSLPGSTTKPTLTTHSPDVIAEDACPNYCDNMKPLLEKAAVMKAALHEAGQPKKHCPPKLRRGDMVQDFIGNSDTTDALPALKGFYGFNKLFNELDTSDEKICDQDKTELRKKSLNAMNQALSFYYGEKPHPVIESDYKDEYEFKRKMTQMWQTLTDSVKKINQKFVTENQTSPDQNNRTLGMPARTSKTMEFVRTALNTDNIPLPSFLEEEEEGQSHFTYSSLSKYFFLGISPITVKKTSDQVMAQRAEHPFSPLFLDGMYALMDHDIQHLSNVTGPLYQRYRVKNPIECKKMLKCFRSMPLAKGPIRKGLFYMLHEDPQPLSQGTVIPNIALEFATEAVLNRNDKKFSLNSFLGKTQSDRFKSCRTVNQIRKTFDDVLESQLIITKPDAGLFQHLKAIFRTKEYIKSTEAANILFPPSLIKLAYENAPGIKSFTSDIQNRLVLESVVRGMMTKLIGVCDAEFPTRKYPKWSLESFLPFYSTLKSNMRSMRKDGFTKSLEIELKKLHGSVEEIGENFENNPACQGVSFPLSSRF